MTNAIKSRAESLYKCAGVSPLISIHCVLKPADVGITNFTQYIFYTQTPLSLPYKSEQNPQTPPMWCFLSTSIAFG